MKQLFTVLLTLIVLTIFGQQDYTDCLSPTSPRNFGILKTYEKKVDEILLSQLSDFQLLVFRQSETIWAIELDTSDLKNPNYFITLVSPTKSIWYSMPDIDNIKTHKFSKNISSQDYELINKLFDSALKTVCAKCHNFGIDGSTYNFSNTVISGRVWSPPKESKRGQLVAISNEIKELIRIDTNKLQLSNELQNRITGLTEAFNKQNANKR